MLSDGMIVGLVGCWCCYLNSSDKGEQGGP